MLRPTDLTVSQYPLATKPALGYEQQLYISTANHTVVGQVAIGGVNSGILTLNTAGAATLLGAPQELIAVLDTDAGPCVSQLVVTVTGLNQASQSKIWTATFVPPAYAASQAIDFPIRFAAELIAQANGDSCSVVQSVAISCDGLWAGVKFSIIGLPPLSSFIKIGTKVKLDYDPKVPMPTAVQDGRDKGAYIKSGEIEVGTCDITVKDPTSADGIWRYRGKRVTGWIKEVKEDVLNTQNIFLGGLIMTPKVAVQEGAEPNTLAATAMFEKFASIPAH